MDRVRPLFGLVAMMALGACASSSSPPPVLGPGQPSDPPGYVPPVLYAAGDIASCDSDGDEATAALLDDLLAADGGQVLALGDLAYESGSAEDFASCYDPSWGRHRMRTIPTPGNHEYNSDAARPFFDYFEVVLGGAPAWDVREFGSWHLVILDSNCDEAGGCGRGSPQGQFLSESMAFLSPAPGWCTLAIWHHPRWSSGVEHGSDARTDGLWRLLYEGGADLVLTGHEHQYERFVPMNADGTADPTGMVEFVVGTGGRSLYEFGDILPTSAAHDNSTFGVLKLTLRAGAYDWEFVSVASAGTGFRDVGSASCR